jgi:hypothetical protein
MLVNGLEKSSLETCKHRIVTYLVCYCCKPHGANRYELFYQGTILRPIPNWFHLCWRRCCRTTKERRERERERVCEMPLNKHEEVRLRATYIYMVKANQQMKFNPFFESILRIGSCPSILSSRQICRRRPKTSR